MSLPTCVEVELGCDNNEEGINYFAMILFNTDQSLSETIATFTDTDILPERLNGNHEDSLVLLLAHYPIPE